MESLRCCSHTAFQSRLKAEPKPLISLLFFHSFSFVKPCEIPVGVAGQGVMKRRSFRIRAEIISDFRASSPASQGKKNVHVQRISSNLNTLHIKVLSQVYRA